MMCMVCGNPVTNDSSRCPVCGFPRIKAVGSRKTAESALWKFSVFYVSEMLRNVEIGLKIYGYRRTAEGLVFSAGEELLLGRYVELKEKETVWNAKRFARIRKAGTDLAAKLTLEVVIRNNDKESVVRTEITPPLTEEDWQIGISRVKEGVIVLHAGTPETNAGSGEINLFACPAVREKLEKGGASA